MYNELYEGFKVSLELYFFVNYLTSKAILGLDRRAFRVERFLFMPLSIMIRIT